jgi:hypothetical protein
VSALTPPPAALKYVSATLRMGDEKQLAIPPGYCVTSASVEVIGPADAAATALVLVGREKFTSADKADQTRVFGEELSIAVAALAPPAAPVAPVAPVTPVAPATPVTPGAPATPADATPPALPALPGAPAELLVSVALVCEPSEVALDQWRITTYDAILKGYQHQMNRFASDSDAAAGRARSQHSVQAARRIEHTQLRQACMRVLLQEVIRKGAAGADDTVLPDPCLLQFLHEALEWSEMSTRYYAGSGSDVPLVDLDQQDDGGLDALLEADMARVMVPADPARVLPLLYFLASGQRWNLAPALAPVHHANSALVQALRQPAASPVPQDGPRWEVVVPTAMQMLDAGFRIGAAARP